jgi:hypothetical protein
VPPEGGEFLQTTNFITASCVCARFTSLFNLIASVSVLVALKCGTAHALHARLAPRKGCFDWWKTSAINQLHASVLCVCARTASLFNSIASVSDLMALNAALHGHCCTPDLHLGRGVRTNGKLQQSTNYMPACCVCAGATSPFISTASVSDLMALKCGTARH